MPNPSVGAVLVHKKRIIAEGFTSAYGGPHAEVNCIAYAKANTPQLIPESTLYVSLEPCSHFGKTPPCADLIIRSQIPRVVIGTIDPYAQVAGRGIQKLKDAGIEVIVGVLEKECLESNARFFTFHLKKRPYIILKWAASQDGFIAPVSKNKQEPVWITNRFSRQLVHKWRSEEQAILIGAATALADNPSLTTRDWSGESPIRVVLDNRANLPKELNVFNEDAKTIRLSTTNPIEICKHLYTNGIQSIIIEGGARTLQAFIDANFWDEARVFAGTSVFKAGVKAPVFKTDTFHIKTISLKNDLLTYYKNETIDLSTP